MTASPGKALAQSIRSAKTPKTFTVAAALAAVVMAVSVPLALAQTPDYGPGMMGGYGAYGMGPGMMGGYGGYGMGPGMMGGYGMGPGMMGGYGGGYGMGPGMMYGYRGGYGGGAGLNLTDEQRGKIGKIQQDLRSKQWDLMGKIQDEYARRADASDDAAASKAEEQITALQQQMFANATAARKQMEAVLTKEQRQQLRRDGY